MRIYIVCTDKKPSIFGYLEKWAEWHSSDHDVVLATCSDELFGGNILFLISCSEIVPPKVRKKFKHVLVVQASAVPAGRGWSPLIWQIIEGKNTIPVALLDAAESVDSGDIWAQRDLQISGHEFFDEINSIFFRVVIELVDFAIENSESVQPRKQSDINLSYYR